MDRLIDEELTDFDYYAKKVPLIYQNSYGFLDMLYSIFYPVLTSVWAMEDLLFSRYIFDPSYSWWIDYISTDEYNNIILDRLASYFGLRRRLIVGGEELLLNNKELLLLIRGQVIKNNFNGTARQAERFYARALEEFNSVILSTTTGHAEATLWLIDASYDDNPITENIIKLFNNGFLTIQSLGISYSYEYVRSAPSDVAIFGQSQFDNSVFGE